MVFRYLIYDRFYRDRLLQYVDILSVSNISLIIMDEKNHGYYLHGRSVHTAADTGVLELNENLRKEEVYIFNPLIHKTLITSNVLE
jgi:meckelin